ncbi:hypothetical protein [Planctobacterium marinum]|uniref:Uncharacterized protein n=1 Tax=Planctobacterium marinum TaxID=1631968 RepID=A0AA48HMF9_9ALTE|nr:hypothetical protein MACH26_06930 [Planctobacterium marinum]
MDLPSNSNIKIQKSDSVDEIIIPSSKGSSMRYFMAAFLIFWLGGWAMGFGSAFAEIMSGEGGAFLVFWLGGWTIGGAFAIYFLHTLLRTPLPEKLLLENASLTYDSGIPPFTMHFGFQTPAQQWKRMFPKRIQRCFTENEVSTIKLRETDSGNRLTIDSGTSRIELASGATEVEREWLHGYISVKYSEQTFHG